MSQREERERRNAEGRVERKIFAKFLVAQEHKWDIEHQQEEAERQSGELRHDDRDAGHSPVEQMVWKQEKLQADCSDNTPEEYE